MPILQQLGLEGTQPTIMPINKVILPAKAAPAAKKKAAGKAKGKAARRR
jgi:hypothetical protein